MSSPPLPPDLAALQRLAVLLDASLPVPFTGRRVGLDGLLGLVPGVGDAVGAALSLAMVVAALRHRVPGPRVLGMVARILVDMGVGAVPVLGDVLDFLYQQNLRNLDVLLAHRDATQAPRSFRDLGAGALLGLGAAALAILGSAAGLLAGLAWGLARLLGT